MSTKRLSLLDSDDKPKMDATRRTIRRTLKAPTPTPQTQPTETVTPPPPQQSNITASQKDKEDIEPPSEDVPIINNLATNGATINNIIHQAPKPESLNQTAIKYVGIIVAIIILIEAFFGAMHAANEWSAERKHKSDEKERLDQWLLIKNQENNAMSERNREREARAYNVTLEGKKEYTKAMGAYKEEVDNITKEYDESTKAIDLEYDICVKNASSSVLENRVMTNFFFDLWRNKVEESKKYKLKTIDLPEFEDWPKIIELLDHCKYGGEKKMVDCLELKHNKGCIQDKTMCPPEAAYISLVLVRSDYEKNHEVKELIKSKETECASRRTLRNDRSEKSFNLRKDSLVKPVDPGTVVPQGMEILRNDTYKEMEKYEPREYKSNFMSVRLFMVIGVAVLAYLVGLQMLFKFLEKNKTITVIAIILVCSVIVLCFDSVAKHAIPYIGNCIEGKVQSMIYGKDQLALVPPSTK